MLRAKTIDLRVTKELTNLRNSNSILNEKEALKGEIYLKTYPRRLVFELTNACNLNCMMCGRNSAKFIPTKFDIEWLRKFDSITDKIEEVTLMGWGEPTIHPDFREFLYWANRNDLRKYFCTNGMLLNDLFFDIFETETDIIAVSLDGANSETNERIRRGSNFKKIVENLDKITQFKSKNKKSFPYMNLVFTAMKSNIRELPELVRLASNIGLDEVKVVYLTAFEKALEEEVLYYEKELITEVFAEALDVAKAKNINLKLPHLVGEDPSRNYSHKKCYTAWRDFFLGSDGYVRPCMSTQDKLFKIQDYNTFEEMWNSKEYMKHRNIVNDEEFMRNSCKNCYQSSFANWNKKDSFIQIDKKFSPDWNERSL